MALRTWTPWAWGSGVHCLGGLGRQQLTARMAKPLLPLVCFALLGQGSPVTQDDQELTVWLRMIWNFRSSFSYLFSAGITGMLPHPGLFGAKDGTQGFMRLGMCCTIAEPQPSPAQPSALLLTARCVLSLTLVRYSPACALVFKELSNTTCPLGKNLLVVFLCLLHPAQSAGRHVQAGEYQKAIPHFHKMAVL